jgi:hypothetical protein
MILEWQNEVPTVPGHWLYITPEGCWEVFFVTEEDIEINKTRPSWLGKGNKWCGPIEAPAYNKT